MTEDGFHRGCPNVSHNQQQPFSGLHKPDPMTLKMASTEVVETSVTTNNSPSQDYTNPTQWLKMASTEVVETSVTTNNSPSQDYTNPTQWLKMASTEVVQTSVTTNNSPSQDYTNPTQWPWRWLPQRLSKRQSQPTIVLLRTTQTRPNDPEDGFHRGCRNVSHNKQQSFSGLHKPDPMTLKMASTEVVETLVTTNNSPSQDYTNPTQWLWRLLPHRWPKRQSQLTTVFLITCDQARTTLTRTIRTSHKQKHVLRSISYITLPC